MYWTIEFTAQAENALRRLDKSVVRRVKKYLSQIKELPNPRMRGESLKGNLSEFWKYRVGDYRIVCEIQDKKLVILIVKIGHRRDVYKI